jgi:hypothetical protein
MSDDYFDEGRTARLTYWGLGQMLKGAGYAAAFLLAIGLVLWVIYGVGLLLPEESKQAPSPYGALEQPLTVQGNDLA